MGFYINPTDMSKSDWLAKNASRVMDDPPSEFPDLTKELLVCLVDNGVFYAAGIAYSKRELEAFTDPADRRFKLWFVVPRDKIVEVCPNVEGELPPLLATS